MPNMAAWELYFSCLSLYLLGMDLLVNHLGYGTIMPGYAVGPLEPFPVNCKLGPILCLSLVSK
jgi:hypothetical protein